jgi:hypothetical protein
MFWPYVLLVLWKYRRAQYGKQMFTDFTGWVSFVMKIITLSVLKYSLVDGMEKYETRLQWKF